MKILFLGANGAVGQLALDDLLKAIQVTLWSKPVPPKKTPPPPPGPPTRTPDHHPKLPLSPPPRTPKTRPHLPRPQLPPPSLHLNPKRSRDDLRRRFRRLETGARPLHRVGGGLLARSSTPPIHHASIELVAIRGTGDGTHYRLGRPATLTTSYLKERPCRNE